MNLINYLGYERGMERKYPFRPNLVKLEILSIEVPASFLWVAFNSHSNTLSRNDPTLMKNESSELSNKDYIPDKEWSPDLNPDLFDLKTMCFPLFFQRKCGRRLATNVGRKYALLLIYIAKLLSGDESDCLSLNLNSSSTIH